MALYKLDRTSPSASVVLAKEFRQEVHCMLIPVVLSGGKEELVSKDDLQFLMDIQQIMLFKRSDGWVVLGQDKMRSQGAPYHGREQRQHEEFSLVQDELFSLDG
jgi:hypothetical protein